MAGHCHLVSRLDAPPCPTPGHLKPTITSFPEFMCAQVHRQGKSDMMGSSLETGAYVGDNVAGRPHPGPFQDLRCMFDLSPGGIMQPASSDGMPDDVLIVEDDPIIALGFEDTILGFGVKTVRSASSVAKALEMIADRAPDFALLDVGLVREKSFAIAERLEALKIPFVFVTGYGAIGAVLGA